MSLPGLTLVVVLGSLGLGTDRAAAGGGKAFPHPTHVEQGLECTECHGAITSSDHLGQEVFPSTETCRQCHESSDLESWGWARIPAKRSPKLNYSHAKHLAQGLECARCHAAYAGQGEGRPSHETCRECHAEVEQTSACGMCHLDLGVLKPLDHDPDYLHTHQFQARGFGDCEACHASSSTCTTCHHGENIAELSHARTWLYAHGQQARGELSVCTDCHDTESFCTPCHVEEGIRPADHFDVGRWLPPVAEHGRAARRDIALCAGCHETADPICVNCHRDDDNRLGTDPNIHPEGWEDVEWEGPWHEDDAADCFLCHDPSSRRTRVGFCTYCHSFREED
jgi:hypothetical protein